MAKLYMENGRDQDAADTLNALLESHSRSSMPLIGPLQAVLGVADLSELQMVGRLRLAKIYLYQDKHEEVIRLLLGFEESSFSARYDEILGDAYAALGQISDANAAYERAMLDDVSAPTVDRALIQMKIVDLPQESGEEPVSDSDDAVDEQ
jgi:tetratricopeptide (TPR) repeat protein